MLFRSDGSLTSSIAKFFSEDKLTEIKSALNVEDGDLVLLVADKYNVVSAALGALRVHMAHALDLIKQGDHSLL